MTCVHPPEGLIEGPHITLKHGHSESLICVCCAKYKLTFRPCLEWKPLPIPLEDLLPREDE